MPPIPANRQRIADKRSESPSEQSPSVRTRRPAPTTTSRHTKGLRDRIQPGIKILFVGINPGLRSAAMGHHFAGHSNRFWKLLFESKLVSEPLTYQDDWRMPDWGLGLTNIIRRPSAGIDELKRSEYASGRKRLMATVQRYAPHIVALLGVTIYRSLFPKQRSVRVNIGLQDETLADHPIFVLPNPSGRNAHYSYQAMLTAFRTLAHVTSQALERQEDVINK